MTGAAWALLGAAGVSAGADWLAVAHRNKPVEYVCKPLTMASLIGVAVALATDDSTRRWLFVAALALSLAGDVFLMLPRDRFVAGLAAFLVAHVAYTAGFLTDVGSPGMLAAGAVVVVSVGAVAARRVISALIAGERKDLVAPVAAYAIAICAMAASAAGSGSTAAMVGAGLFLASDTTIAWNRFVAPLTWAPLFIIVTYHLGQAGLVLSLAG